MSAVAVHIEARKQPFPNRAQTTFSKLTELFQKMQHPKHLITIFSYM